MKTHWKRLQNSDYIGVYSVDPDAEPVLTVAKITRERVAGENGRIEEETVMHFCEKTVTGLPDVKPLILNKTNQKTLEKIFRTPFIEDWIGKSIQLTVRKEKAFGELMDVLRVKAKLPTMAAIVCADCKVDIPSYQGITGTVIAQESKKKYGEALCYECSQKRKEQAQNGTNSI